MSSNVHDDDVRSGPDRYISELGVAKDIGRYLSDYRHPVIVSGEHSWNAFVEYADEVPEYPVFRYDGSATLRNAQELAQIIGTSQADAIVAIGAGKLSDTAKNVAEILGIDLIMVPTLAATCAAYSALSVNYDDRHRYVDAPLHSRNSNLAKWYESRPVFESGASLAIFDRLSRQSALLIRETLLKESELALKALRRGEANEHLRLVVDTNIALAGTVGGFGGCKARASGAHSMHDALTLLPQTASVVHGMKVAYGIMVQLVAEGRSSEARALIPFYDAVGLPHSLTQIGVDSWNNAVLRKVAELASSEQAAFARAVPGITADDVMQAMEQVERLQ